MAQEPISPTGWITAFEDLYRVSPHLAFSVLGVAALYLIDRIADNNANEIESQFQTDALIQVARDLVRAVVDDESHGSDALVTRREFDELRSDLDAIKTMLEQLTT